MRHTSLVLETDGLARAVARTHTAPQTATNAAEGNVFRLHAYKKLDRSILQCPPARTVLLYRMKSAANRRFLNEPEIINMLLYKYGITNFEHTSISGTNTSAEQVRLAVRSVLSAGGC